MSLTVSLVAEKPVKVGGSDGLPEGSRMAHPAIRFHVNEVETNQVWCGVISHQLGRMAEAIGVYTPIWRPENTCIEKALHMVVPLACAYRDAVEREAELRALEPANRLGTYEAFLNFIKNYLNACIQHPDAVIRVTR